MNRARLGGLFGLLTLVACGQQTPQPEVPVSGLATSGLFFSEYVEGSSNNKALEVYNGTGAAVDLATEGYVVQMYFNGNPSAGLTINLTGAVADGDVFVLAQASAGAAILAQADQTNGAGWFNGDDAVVLRQGGAGGTVVDTIGQIGTDPGSEWGSGLTSTADNTLRRQADVCAGDADPSDAFDPANEWDGFATDTFDGLGAHTADCGGVTEPGTPELVINEIDYDQPGTDTAEFIELKNTGTAAVNLEPYSVQLVNGSNNQVYETIDLPNASLATGDYFVVCANASATPNCDLDVSPDSNLIQNGAPDAAAIVLDGEVVDTVSYEGDVPGYTEGTGAPADTDGENLGLSRLPDGTDTNDNSADFGLSCITPGETNTDASSNCPAPGNGGGDGGEVGQCSEPATLISAVQGAGEISPLESQSVVIEGIVVGDFQEGDGDAFDTDLGGFYVQEEADDYDADPETSEGVFVFAPDAPDMKVGDVMRVRGTVDEFFGLTELTDVTGLATCGTAPVPAPAEVTLPVSSLSDLEHYEGMLVAFPQELVISEYFNFDRFGEIVLAQPMGDLERPYQPTSYVQPGSAAAEVAAANVLSRITLDDGRSAQNPDPARHPNGDEFTLENRFRGGDTVRDATGILDYRFDRYRLQPTKGAAYSERNLRPAEPEDVGGSLKVASFNVLNYFTTLGSRGADDEVEFERQAAKIVAALEVIDADIFGLIEIENNTTAVNDLVNRLNAAAGAGTYTAVETGAIGTDQIKVAIIYKPAAVTPVGDYAVLDASDDARFIDTRNRPVLIQTFDENATGGRFTVAVNHLKSKGSGCGAGDDDPQQGSCNETRTQAAEALADYLATDPTSSGDPDYLIIGDLNAYDEEDPIVALKEGADDAAGTTDDYTDLVEQFEGEFAYSYVFDGQFGHLDYALANQPLLGQVTDATEWHINADEPDLLDYDTTFKEDAQDALYEPNAFRSSDHDPIIVGLALVAQDPQEALAALIADVEALSEDSGLNRGQVRSLLAQLETAQRQLEAGRERQAAEALVRFERRVGDYLRRGDLSSEQGEPLLERSQRIRAGLE